MTADGRPLRDSLEDYLALRRALGFRLKTAGRLLDQFVSWLDDRGSDTITTEDALAWAVLPPGASQACQVPGGGVSCSSVVGTRKNCFIRTCRRGRCPTRCRWHPASWP